MINLLLRLSWKKSTIVAVIWTTITFVTGKWLIDTETGTFIMTIIWFIAYWTSYKTQKVYENLDNLDNSNAQK